MFRPRISIYGSFLRWSFFFLVSGFHGKDFLMHALNTRIFPARLTRRTRAAPPSVVAQSGMSFAVEASQASSPPPVQTERVVASCLEAHPQTPASPPCGLCPVSNARA